MAIDQHGQVLDFVTLGMFIVDEIHFKPPKAPELDVLGGAGSWSVVGARLFRPAPSSKRVGWIIHRGSDFPEKLSDQIDTWQTDCHLIDTPERLTTRGWNSYGDDEARAFKYMTPKLRIDHTQLNDKQVLARCFHIISTPTRCVDLVQGILGRRKLLDCSSKPVFIWEPVPDACCPEELPNALKALQHIDIISPNHQELAAFFNQEARTTDSAADEERLANWCRTLLQTGFPKDCGAVVVRAGERGVLWVEGRDMRPRTLPAWHQASAANDSLESSARVVDPTGAGNAFLGGFSVGFLDASEDGRSADQMSRAVMYGIVAASFAIEQVGMPTLAYRAGEELWNDDSVVRRIEVLKKRVT